MFSTTLFNIGPFNICLWNIFFISIIFLVAAVLRRMVHRLLKKYAKSANITIEGRRVTWLKMLSQSVYLLAIYIAVLSFKFNNKNITFGDLFKVKLINLPNFKLDFSDLLVIVSVFFGTRIIVNLSTLIISKRFQRSQDYDKATEFIYVQIAKYFIYIFSIFFCFQLLNITSLLLGGSAAILVGIGFGIQDVFKDFVAGFVLLFEAKLRVGDIVQITPVSKGNTKSFETIVAKILKINLRTTEIQTREGNILIIPNTRLTQEQVENWSHGSELTLFTIKITVEYGSNTELIQHLLKQAALAHPNVNKNEPVMVRLADFAESGLELELIFWADQSWDINNYKSEIRFEIDRLFREYKIKIPYPQRVMHVMHESNQTSGQQ
jgi:small-conductance mechanosensitive channel